MTKNKVVRAAAQDSVQARFYGSRTPGCSPRVNRRLLRNPLGSGYVLSHLPEAMGSRAAEYVAFGNAWARRETAR